MFRVSKFLVNYTFKLCNRSYHFRNDDKSVTSNLVSLIELAKLRLVMCRDKYILSMFCGCQTYLRILDS